MVAIGLIPIATIILFSFFRILKEPLWVGQIAYLELSNALFEMFKEPLLDYLYFSFGLFYFLNDSLESFWIVHSKVCKDFAVDFYSSLV